MNLDISTFPGIWAGGDTTPILGTVLTDSINGAFSVTLGAFIGKSSIVIPRQGCTSLLLGSCRIAEAASLLLDGLLKG